MRGVIKGGVFIINIGKIAVHVGTLSVRGAPNVPDTKPYRKMSLGRGRKSKRKTRKKVMKTIAIGIKRRQVCGEFENGLVQRNYI